MRRLLVVVLLMISLCSVEAIALDLGRALRSAAGQVIKDAVRSQSAPSPQNYSSPPVQHQQQQQSQAQAQSYTYEEYMAIQNDASAGDSIADSELPGEFTYETDDTPKDLASGNGEEDFDPDNPFAGLVDEEEDAPAANARKSSGDKESDTIEVVATGIGQDSDRALKNALRAAIEQAVGTLVDSETLAQNDEVVNDQILSYSAGFVESHKVIGEPRHEMNW